MQPFVTLCACARGKAIGFVCRRRYENRQISRSRHSSDSLTQRIRRIRQTTGFSMLQIVWHDPQTSQIVCLLATPIDCAYCTAGHVLSAHAHNWPSMCR